MIDGKEIHLNSASTKKLIPCKNCKDRKVNCHASCKKYKNYRKKLDEENEINRKRTWEKSL